MWDFYDNIRKVEIEFKKLEKKLGKAAFMLYCVIGETRGPHQWHNGPGLDCGQNKVGYKKMQSCTIIIKLYVKKS